MVSIGNRTDLSVCDNLLYMQYLTFTIHKAYMLLQGLVKSHGVEVTYKLQYLYT